MSDFKQWLAAASEQEKRQVLAKDVDKIAEQFHVDGYDDGIGSKAWYVANDMRKEILATIFPSGKNVDGLARLRKLYRDAILRGDYAEGSLISIHAHYENISTSHLMRGWM